MIGKQIKPYAMLHFVFIVIIAMYYINRNDLFSDDGTLDNSPQVYRYETDEGLFNREQVEEILIDILIPLQEPSHTTQDTQQQTQNAKEAEPTYRQNILNTVSTDTRVQFILESKSFTTPQATDFLAELQEKYKEKNIEFPNIPSPTPLQMTLEEWMMDVYLYLKHQVGEEPVLDKPFVMDGRSDGEIQAQIEIYVQLANKHGILLPPEPIIDTNLTKTERDTPKNSIIEAYLNGEIRKLQNAVQQSTVSIETYLPSEEEIEKSINSGDLSTAESKIVLEKIQRCYEELHLKYVSFSANTESEKTPTEIQRKQPVQEDTPKTQVSTNQSQVMEAFFASEIRKMYRLAEMQNKNITDCLPTDAQVEMAIQSGNFSTKEGTIVLDLIQTCYDKFGMIFVTPQ